MRKIKFNCSFPAIQPLRGLCPSADHVPAYQSAAGGQG